MSEIIDFIKTNYLAIVIVGVVSFILLVIINIKGIDLNQTKQGSKLVKQVIVETLVNRMDNLELNPEESFCEAYLGNSSELEGACNQLSDGKCSQVKCCVKTGDKCVAGDLHGPTYKTDKDGKLVTMDAYYYLGKRYLPT